ncbi:MAG: glycosyltransferase family 9 protein [Motilibacteraceae bacterium]
MPAPSSLRTTVPPLADGDLVPDVRKIAVVRANALGDYLFAEPALSSLKAAYPDAELVLIGAPWHARFLPGRPGPVDRVLVAPVHPGVRNPKPGDVVDPEAQRAFFEQARAERFDLALQMHGGGRNSNPFTLALGARVTAGTRTPDAEHLDREIPYSYFAPEVFRFLEVVGLVGAPPVRIRPRLEPTSADRAAALAAVPDDGRPLAVLHPGATDRRRRWPGEHFAAVGLALVAAGARVLVTGTEPEREVVDEVVAAMAGRAEPLVDVLDIGGLAGLLSRASVLVSNDTGPRHLAEAVGTPTVAVYWCGNLVNAGPITRRTQRPHVAWTVHCPVCGADASGGPSGTEGRGCDHDVSFVADVPVETVVADAVELLRLAGTCGSPTKTTVIVKA